MRFTRLQSRVCIVVLDHDGHSAEAECGACSHGPRQLFPQPHDRRLPIPARNLSKWPRFPHSLDLRSKILDQDHQIFESRLVQNFLRGRYYQKAVAEDKADKSVRDLTSYLKLRSSHQALLLMSLRCSPSTFAVCMILLSLGRGASNLRNGGDRLKG